VVTRSTTDDTSGSNSFGPLPSAQVVVELVARDREQVGAKRRSRGVLIAGAHDRQEGRLGQIGRVVALGGEEAVERVEVPREQRLTRRLLAGAPPLDQLGVGIHAAHRITGSAVADRPAGGRGAGRRRGVRSR
jgi:hypothetical protein